MSLQSVGSGKMMLIFIDEDDTFEHMPLYEAILRRLRKLDVAGAQVFRGIMGYGSQHRIFGQGTLGIPDNRPITIVVIEQEEVISRAIHEIKAIVGEGVIVVIDALIHPIHQHPPSS